MQRLRKQSISCEVAVLASTLFCFVSTWPTYAQLRRFTAYDTGTDRVQTCSDTMLSVLFDKLGTPHYGDGPFRSCCPYNLHVRMYEIPHLSRSRTRRISGLTPCFRQDSADRGVSTTLAGGGLMPLT